MVGDPKSRAGKREIVLPAFLHVDVGRHPEWFAQPGREGLVFVGEKGAALRGTTFGRKWREAGDRAGLPKHVRSHDLRHTGNTLAADVRRRQAKAAEENGEGATVHPLVPRQRDVEGLAGREM
ncbi:hypothetical protein GCM10009753_52840 [Streptantibioticus ferralitis]